MPSLKFSVLAAATALFSVVRADYYVDPNSVPIGTRKNWCTSEISTCPLICQQTAPFTTEVNTCDAASLTYGCVCGNGLQPNVSEYSLTLPFFVCQEWGNQCVTKCGNNNPSCASSCRQDHPCGAQDPTRVNVTSSASGTATGADATSSAPADQVYSGIGGSEATTTKGGNHKTTATATGDATATGKGDSTASGTAAGASSTETSSTKSFAAPAVDLSRSLGLMVTLGSLFVGFALVL